MKKNPKRLILISLLVLVLIIGAMSFAHIVRANREAQDLRQEFFNNHPDAQSEQTDVNAPSQRRPLNGVTSDMMNFVHNTLGVPTPEFVPPH